MMLSENWTWCGECGHYRQREALCPSDATDCSRILDYVIAREYTYRPDHMGGRLATFDEKVRELLKEGWYPIGGPFMDNYGAGQAMVRYAPISSEND